MATQSLNDIIKQATSSTSVPVGMTPSPGAMQYTDGGQATMVPPAPMSTTFRQPAPTNPSPTPVSAGTPTPTNPIDEIMSRFNTIKTGVDKLAQEQTVGQSFATPEFEKGLSYEEIYGEEPDEEAIRKQQLRLFQGQIDATNTIYDQMLNEARMEGQGRLGSQRAMAARGGLLGSDFGASQKSKVQDFNTDINRSIQAERTAKIGSILGDVRSAVSTEIANKRAARQQGAENYLEYLKGESTRKQNNINLAATALLTQGIDPSTLDENELGAIAMESGTTPQNIIMQYQQLASAQAAESAATDLKTRKTEAEISKINSDVENSGFFNLSEGQSRYDAQGNVIASKGKTYAPDRGGSGGSNSLNLTPDGQRTLLGGGWTESEISTLQSDIREYGLQEVIKQAQKTGASVSQIASLEKAYKTVDGEEDETNLSRENLANLFQLSESDKGKSILGFEYGKSPKEQLDTLVDFVERYRAVGYTDKEILKLMQ